MRVRHPPAVALEFACRPIVLADPAGPELVPLCQAAVPGLSLATAGCYNGGMTKPVRIDESWRARLAAEFDAPYFTALRAFVRDEYQVHTIYPPAEQMFRAFDACPFEATKVVILGQDPYHGPGQANGLCFAVNPGVPAPPSLKNMFKELDADMGAPVSRDPDLTRWARQGALLLNATLTVRQGSAGSHQNKGWEQFTDAAIAALASCGATMLGKRAQRSSVPSIWCWSVRTPRPCRPTMAFSGAGTFPRPTPI
jgi:uracil-DNA glycosylase